MPVTREEILQHAEADNRVLEAAERYSARLVARPGA
jgi:hypothetical protein